MKGTTSDGLKPDVIGGWAPALKGACPRRLPKVRIRGRLYFQDDRLHEFRSVDKPWDTVSFEAMNWAIAILGKWPD